MHYMFVNQCLALSVVVFGLSAMCVHICSEFQVSTLNLLYVELFH
jgi:hypothetical protein